MFPPKGAPAGPPKNLRQVRRDVGTPMPETAAAPQDSRAVVSMSCPSCGAPIEQTFTAQVDEPAPDAGAAAPPFAAGGGDAGGLGR